jgi:hypothetical protein
MQETNQKNTEIPTPKTKLIVAMKLHFVLTAALVCSISSTTMVLP